MSALAARHAPQAEPDPLRVIHDHDWMRAHEELDRDGVTHIPRLLGASDCAALQACYGDSDRFFRSRVVMQRHGFGRGEYQYFCDPLPPLVQLLREAIYPHLAPVANRWAEQLRQPQRFPPSHAEFREQCHAAGQTRPTPLLLRYGAGDYNCLHQDLYGALVFPLQVVVLLSEPGRDFDGGELVLVEQRPRMQSRPQVISLRRGDAAIFAVNHRPVTGARGACRVALRHGVSRLHRGERYTLGIIFHDAA
jgi:uncharacterized protein